MNKNKGFTLIELLVVIAIIGILSSVVLASLSNARDKGKDAAVKSQLASMKAQAELYYSAKDETYDGVCAATKENNGFGGEEGPGLLKAAADSSGSISNDDDAIVIDTSATGDWDQAICNDKADDGSTYGGWAVVVPLSDSTSTSPSFYCVDNTGLAQETSTSLDADDIVCN